MSSKSFSLRTADILAIQFLENSKYIRTRYVRTAGNFIACSQCCHTFRERFAVLPAWIIKSDHVNKKNRFLKCQVCESRIFTRYVAR